MISRRRFVVALAAAAAAAPRAGIAQKAQGPTLIGVLPLGSSANEYDRSLVAAFRRGLRDVGLVENRDVTVEVVWVGNESDYPRALTELEQRGVKLLIPAGTSASVAAKRHTSTIPIVFTTVGDPIGVGLVASLARPGGNATGFSDVLLDLSGKLVELAKDVAEPQAPVYYLWFTGWANGEQRFRATERAARSSAVELRSFPIANLDEVSTAMASMKKSGALACIVQPSPFTYLQRNRLIESALNRNLGTIFAWPAAAREGAVVAYGPDYADLYRRAAAYVDRIIRGARPGDLPVEQPTKFELVINLKSARALGLLVPQSLIVRADEVMV